MQTDQRIIHSLQNETAQPDSFQLLHILTMSHKRNFTWVRTPEKPCRIRHDKGSPVCTCIFYTGIWCTRIIQVHCISSGILRYTAQLHTVSGYILYTAVQQSLVVVGLGLQFPLMNSALVNSAFRLIRRFCVGTNRAKALNSTIDN
jgi:hypothetical protein